MAGCPTTGVPMSWYFEALRNPSSLAFSNAMLLPFLPRFVSWFQGRPGEGETQKDRSFHEIPSIALFLFLSFSVFSPRARLAEHIEEDCEIERPRERYYTEPKFKIENRIPGVEWNWQYP